MSLTLVPIISVNLIHIINKLLRMSIDSFHFFSNLYTIYILLQFIMRRMHNMMKKTCSLSLTTFYSTGLGSIHTENMMATKKTPARAYATSMST